MHMALDLKIMILLHYGGKFEESDNKIYYIREIGCTSVECEYVEFDGKYKLASHSFLEQRELDGTTHTRFEGKIDVCGDMKEVAGVGNGPIDSFFQALAGIGVEGYEFVNYHEHAISRGSDAKGICYIELKIPGNGHIFGVGIDSNINVAALLGILCAINRAEK